MIRNAWGRKWGELEVGEGICKGLRQELADEIEEVGTGQVFLLALQVCLGIDFIPSAMTASEDFKHVSQIVQFVF